MKLIIGFITYNNLTGKYLPFFLPSLLSSLAVSGLEETDWQIMAVDNSELKDNDNRAYISANYPQIDFTWAGDNLGFSKGYNLMLDRAVKLEAEYFLMLNPDMLLEPESIKNLLLALEANGHLGSVAPEILQWNFLANQKTNIIDTLGLRLLPGLRFIDSGQGQIDFGGLDNLEILGPSGAAGMFRLKALEAILVGNQYFDERFFMYKEDCDLSYRLFLAGFKSQLVATAVMYHDRTAKVVGRDLLATLKNRRHKSRVVNKWSFLGQQIIYSKYWSGQNFNSRLRIAFDQIRYLFLALLFEHYLLPEYGHLWFRLKSHKSLKK